MVLDSKVAMRTLVRSQLVRSSVNKRYKYLRMYVSVSLHDMHAQII
jgi:hypothetical protein